MEQEFTEFGESEITELSPIHASKFLSAVLLALW